MYLCLELHESSKIIIEYGYSEVFAIIIQIHNIDIVNINNVLNNNALGVVCVYLWISMGRHFEIESSHNQP